ncbi:TPA: AhpC/TSA family protein [Vibrio vulnificus]|jgi:peroxiredoxin|nr:AhpC/TSA family protein [Vibrio vulnificus]
MSLETQLAEVRKGSAKNIPTDKHAIMLAETEILKTRALEDQAPKVGELLPGFELRNQLGELTALNDLLKNGPIIVTFYRGGWCPYCNLELRAYQSVLENIRALGAQLVAITPELPDASLSTIEKNALAFNVLSDVDALYAKSLGIVFTLPDTLKPIYEGFGIHVEQHNGEGKFDLPLAATFVLDTSGKIIFADVNADYTRRAEPAAVLSVLNKLHAA